MFFFGGNFQNFPFFLKLDYIKALKSTAVVFENLRQ
jgi:hypothetical protein